MKLSTGILAIAAAASTHQAVAFAPSASSQHKSTALRAENRNNVAMGASAFILGLGLSAQAAFANDASIDQYKYATTSAITSSTMTQSAIDQFTLPSYDASKGLDLIDLSSEVDSVNRKTAASEKAKREYNDTSAEKKEMDELRRIEADEKKLFDSMVQESNKDKLKRIAEEKAEARANRYKTF